MTNKERLEANNAKLKEIQETLNNKILKASGNGEYFVKVIDYDGTILKEANLNTSDTFTLPTPPSHNGLIFQEWSSSQDIVNNVITIEDNNVMVGAVYTTASGLNEFDIEITKNIEPDIVTNGFVVTLNMNGTKDWGDGTSDTLTTHTYTNYGKYTIKCNGDTLTPPNSSTGIFGNSVTSYNYYCTAVRLATITSLKNSVFTYCQDLTTIIFSNLMTSGSSNMCSSCRALKAVVLPPTVKGVAESAFNRCYSMTNAVIPQTVTSISNSAFYYCFNLCQIALPSNIKTFGTYIFNGCYSLTEIIIPDSVTSINSSFLDKCYSLKKVRLPKNLTSLGRLTFDYCYNLRHLDLPQTLSTIGDGAFGYCYALSGTLKIPPNVISLGGDMFANNYSLNVLDFSNHTQVPTINTRALGDVNGLLKIIVPDELYEEWIVAPNWPINRIYKASEMN